MSVRLIAAAAALATATAAHAQSPACIPQRQAEALFLVVAPTVIGSVAATCAPALPTGAVLRRSLGPLTAKYAGEADAAWPVAREALRKIVGPDAAQMLDSELARPMLTAMVAPMLAKEVTARDCPHIDRVLGLIDPLPARNTAALVVTILAMSDRDGARSRRGFAVCPTGPRP